MKYLKELVGRLYYTHGMFCASHPFATILGVIAITALACYPLLSVPLLVSAPYHLTTPVNQYSPPPPVHTDATKFPRWYVDVPAGYIQQIIVKATVAPWQPKQLLPIDAVRAPLGKVFDIHDIIRKFKLTEGSSTGLSIADLCVRVGETTGKQKLDSLLPQYDCLLLSPTQLWKNDKQRYLSDSAILKTIYQKYGNQLDPPPSVQDLLFGVQWKKTGLSRYLIRNRQRTMTYAITVIFKQYHHDFIEKLKATLISQYRDTLTNSNASHVQHITHLYYLSVNYFIEYTPLLVAYIILFLYIYFSVRKIEIVKFKWGLAVSAVATVIASLLMSLSICTMLGLTPTLKGSEIFPYLGIIIGLENILVLTKSVMSTPQNFNVRNRLAIGLHKEGWSITKNLASEFIIVLIGFCTFVPAIQEFCAFALVGLLSDFFLQMFFFSTVLSIDIRRTEDLPIVRIPPVYKPGSDEPTAVMALFRCPVMAVLSHRRATPDPSPQHTRPEPVESVSRRWRVLSFIARTRFLQRAIMVCTIVWISFLVYKTGIVERITMFTTNKTSTLQSFNQSHLLNILRSSFDADILSGRDEVDLDSGWRKEAIPEQGILLHSDYEMWTSLYDNHWIKLFAHYNISLFGKYISILPSIHLSIKVPPDEAQALRLPSEIFPRASGFRDDASYDADAEAELYRRYNSLDLNIWRELAISVVLGTLSMFFILWFGLIIYNCIWPGDRGKASDRGVACGVQTVVPSPTTYTHTQDIECMAAENGWIVTTCLGGTICVWNSTTMECHMTISRDSVYVEEIPASNPAFHTQDFTLDSDAINAGIVRRASHSQRNSPPPVTTELSRHTSEHVENFSYTGDRRYTRLMQNVAPEAVMPQGDPVDYSERKPRANTLPGVLANHASSDLQIDQSKHPVHESAGKISEYAQSVQRVIGSDESTMTSRVNESKNHTQESNNSQQTVDQSNNRLSNQSGQSYSSCINANQSKPFSKIPDHSQSNNQYFHTNQSYRPIQTANESSNPVQIPQSFGSMFTCSGTQFPSNSITTNQFPTYNNYSESTSTYSSPGSTERHEFIQNVPSNLTRNVPNDLHVAGTMPQFTDDANNSHIRTNHSRRVTARRPQSYHGASGSHLDDSAINDLPIPYPETTSATDATIRKLDNASIWCLAFDNGLILAGCSNGRIEFWDASSGLMKCVHESTNVGVMAAVFVYKNVACVARIDGTVEFLHIEVILSPTPPHPDSTYTSMIKGHSRHSSLTSLSAGHSRSNSLTSQPSLGATALGDRMTCVMVDRVKAHFQPITGLVAEAGLVISASKDHTLKIIDPRDCRLLHNLHNHSGPVTCIRAESPLILSGSNDATVCVWHLSDGKFIQKLTGHTGAVVSLVLTLSYVVSLCDDCSLYIWNRRNYTMLKRVVNSSFGGHSLELMSDDIVVTGFQNQLCLCKLGPSPVCHDIPLQCDDSTSQITLTRVLSHDSIVCTLGKHVAFANFPAAFKKSL